ncbi:hypothetical protein FN976_09430 [Caenimonas sedimenti]|uniref:Molecular chaperone DnaJ n=1 Tax=Caenimonas sedimenti TaxID=2596921 RepID=A0A562ZTC9_9BURK|nr:hypothetical protein [Caenimonas sedimenti]TWO71588.1 hypothetical protein FN976_09430 [Caenimonas sedimenti]
MAAKQDRPSVSSPAVRAEEPLDLAQSVAGEEDPGASIDLAGAPGRSDQPAGQAPGQPSAAQPPMRPGDEAPEGTAGTGEDVCPRCGGSGRLGASSCPECAGTGRVTVGIGGA